MTEGSLFKTIHWDSKVIGLEFEDRLLKTPPFNLPNFTIGERMNEYVNRSAKIFLQWKQSEGKVIVYVSKTHFAQWASECLVSSFTNQSCVLA